MLSYIIEGGNKLEGTVSISGSKNASLPIIAGTILSSKTTKLYNVPNIHDTQITLKILKLLGCKVKRERDKIEINTKQMNKTEIPEDLMRQMRSTVIMAGAIIGRFKEATFSYPGGCEIGARPIDLHLEAFKKLGINIEEKAGFIHCTCDKIIGAEIHLDFPSVGATENIMLAATKCDGVTVIHNAAREPEIIDLQNFLVACGAKITGAGTSTILIQGVKKLRGVSYRVIPDRIIAGTYLVAAAMTRGQIILNDICSAHLEATTSRLEMMGCQLIKEKNRIILSCPKELKGIDIITEPYPGFPTDMQSQMMVLLCTCKEPSSIKENLFEARFKIVDELIKMGADIKVKECTAYIRQYKKLHGANICAKDLRGGAALVLAGLVAEGCTTVDEVQHIERGYQNIVADLSKLGAQIQERK